MNNHILEEELHDFADGELTAEARARVETHLAACAECKKELDELRALVADLGGLPKAIDPPRDLWPAVSARIVRERPRAGRRMLPWLAAAAAVAAVSLKFALDRPVVEDRPAAVHAHVRAKPVAALAAFHPSELDYLSAAEELEHTLEERKTKLKPETVAVIEENLRVIDQALDNIRAALAADPASRDLTFMLASTYEMKLDLLRQATSIPQTM